MRTKYETSRLKDAFDVIDVALSDMPGSCGCTDDVIARWLAGEVTTDLVQMYLGDADSLLAALAAAGWEPHRAGEVVPTSDVLNLAQRWDDLYFPGHLARADELRALTQQEAG